MSFDPIPLEPTAAPANTNALFRPVPVSGVGGGGGDATEWGDIEGEITDQTDLNGALGQINGLAAEALGTANGAAAGVATAATTAQWSGVSGVPAHLTTAQAAGTASIRSLGTNPNQAAAGDHTHAIANITGLQAALDALSLRIDALEP